MIARRLVAVAALAAAALLAASCNLNEFCLGCDDDDPTGDGGTGDGGADAADDGAMPDACIPVGLEVCNGLDDDCDGEVDEEVPTVGDACGTNTGVCTEGVIACQDGVLRCTGVAASPEQCNGLDDDCDGGIDEGNPGGGASCGSNVGECRAGTTQCVGGAIECIGAVGTPGQDPEICDGLDNDCDGPIDEGIPGQGPCGFPAVGLCVPGELRCVGGEFRCLGGQGPTFEQCDDLDHDCDGEPTNGFDLDNDIRNCGACGTSCIGMFPNATARCRNGQCEIASCNTNYHDDPDAPGPDCDYYCEYQGPVEACNGRDDDCDGVIDEGLTPPPICLQQGACAGTVASCVTVGDLTAWDCVYGPDVSVDANGDLVPETRCDGLDNDCDGAVDESHPTVGQACVGDGLGVCQDRGHLACDPGAPAGPPRCVIDEPGGTAGPEACDGLDNDCDGVVDNGALTGALQEWVAIGGGREMMRYEASRPDARDDTAGSVTSYPCSRASVLPWTLISAPEAQAACAAIGARLCTEQEWHRACAVVSGTAWPIVQDASGNAPFFLEAEDYHTLTPGTSGGTTRTWVPDSTPGFSGISALRASPNTGAAVGATNAPAQAPRLDYEVDFRQTGSTYVWVRLYSISSNDRAIHVGIGLTPAATQPQQSIQTSSNNTWQWVRTAAINVPATGPRFVSIYMNHDGVKVDRILVTRSSSTTAPTSTTGPGFTWSYATNATTYQPATCNGQDHDTNPILAGNQDDLLPTGSMASCYANHGATARPLDLSGNVKEWTAPRQPGVNPIRGGASNNTADGISCALAFTAADDDFFFSNVGFRCCR